MLPMRLGLDSMESERSRTKSLARSRAVLANTSEGTRASKESHEPVPCGKRCEAGLDETHPVCRRENRPSRSLECPECGILRTPLYMHNQGCVQRWHVVRLAPAQSSGESRE